MAFPTGGLTHFREAEFDRPEMISEELFHILDAIRAESGVPIKVTSDGRTEEETAILYPDPTKRPNSPHKRGALDFKPMPHNAENRLKVLAAIMKLWSAGRIPRMGLEIADRHFHLDMDTELRRPHLWTGKSK